MSWKALITDAGNELSAKTISGGSIKLTHAKAGSGTVSEQDLHLQTELVNVKQTLSIESIKYSNAVNNIEILLDCRGLKEAYDLTQIGIYATDPDAGEILFAIAQTENPKHIPAENEVPFYSIDFNFAFALKNNQNMVATIDQSTFATKEQLSAVDARIDNIIVNAGSTEDNAELIDMRVDVDGKIHGTAGEALRSQLKQKANLTDISSPYQFRGACLSANLPGSGNKINDTYYVTDKKCKFTWNGAAWYQSSLNESDYEEELSSLTEDLSLLIKIEKIRINTAQQNIDYKISLIVGDEIEITNKTNGGLAVKLYKDNTVVDTITKYLTKDESIRYTVNTESDTIRFWSQGTGYVKVENLNSLYQNIQKYDVMSSGINVIDGSFDLDDCIPNRIYTISAKCKNTPNNSTGTLISFANSVDSKNAIVQIMYNLDNKIYTRYNVYGIGWSEWNEIANYNYKDNCLLSMFDKVGVIGDSYASGEIYGTDGVLIGDKYKISWIQQLARRNGFKAFNFSEGGLSTRTWLTSNYGLEKMNNTEICDIYILALGINDYYGLGESYLGDKSDIASGNDTFYGNYSKIINAVRDKAPTGKIMISTIAIRKSETSEYKRLIKMYNDAIIEIANEYNIPIIRQDKYPYFDSYAYEENMIHGHPTAVGYSIMATELEKCIGNAMCDNDNYFESGDYYN